MWWSELWQLSIGIHIRCWWLYKCVFDEAFNYWATNNNEDPVANSAFWSVSMELKPFFNNHHVALYTQHSFDGMMFACSSMHIGNSLIMYYLDQKTTNSISRSIEHIVRHWDSSTSFVIHRQMPLNIGSIDPFNIYSQFPASLHSTKLLPQLKVIIPTRVMSYYAW